MRFGEWEGKKTFNKPYAKEWCLEKYPNCIRVFSSIHRIHLLQDKRKKTSIGSNKFGTSWHICMQLTLVATVMLPCEIVDTAVAVAADAFFLSLSTLCHCIDFHKFHWWGDRSKSIVKRDNFVSSVRISSASLHPPAFKLENKKRKSSIYFTAQIDKVLVKRSEITKIRSTYTISVAIWLLLNFFFCFPLEYNSFGFGWLIERI